MQPSHTNGDTAVKFVKADVLMTGDVFRSEGMPNAAVVNGGDIKGLLAVMEPTAILMFDTQKILVRPSGSEGPTFANARWSDCSRLREKVGITVSSSLSLRVALGPWFPPYSHFFSITHWRGC